MRMDFDLPEMLQLRRQGWSTVALGKRYNKDHTTITYHCLKHGIILSKLRSKQPEMDEEFEIVMPVRERIVDKYAYIYNEQRNVGKSYRQYALEAKQLEKKQKAEALASAFAAKESKPTGYIIRVSLD